MQTTKPYSSIMVTTKHALRHLPIADNLKGGRLRWLLFRYFTRCADYDEALMLLNSILIRDGERCIDAASLYHVIRHHASQIAHFTATADGGFFWEF